MTKTPKQRFYLETDGPLYWGRDGWVAAKTEALTFASAEAAAKEIEDNVEVWKPAFDESGWIELPVRDPEEHVEVKSE